MKAQLRDTPHDSPRLGSRRRIAAAFAVSAFAMAGPTLAGPPYVTDDPEPTDTGHWEVFGFVSGADRGGSTDGDGGLDINYGAAPDLQLTLALPVAYERSVGSHMGLGDVEAGIKYRFLHQSPGSAMPDVAIFPAFTVPTASHRVGSGHWGVSLPIWAQKDFGPWSLFGGGEYTLNPGAGNRNYWSDGVAVQRTLSDHLAVGAEIYHHGSDADGARPFTGMNLGVTYRLNPHWSLAASGGPGLQNSQEGGRFAFYLALKADY